MLCLFLFVQETLAVAFQCPTIDLTKQPPLSERKHLFQGDTKWCCSFAFVDALALKYGKNFSPVDIAITQAQAQMRLRGCEHLDEIPKALNASHGVCAENEFRQMSNQGKKFENLKEGDDRSEYRSFLDKESHDRELLKLYALWNQSKTDPAFRNRICEFGTRNSPIFTNIKNYRDIGAVLQKGFERDYFDFLYSLAEKNCAHREMVQIHNEDFDISSENINDLFQFLREGNSPIFNIYTQSLFNNPNPDASLNLQLSEWLKGDHAVNVVGVRPIGEQCYVKVRDSSYGGKNCNDINKTWVICSPASKDDGTYEVEIETFIKATREGLVIK
ncbi:MAG: hypothetical protein ACXVCP_11080 [Bdellovibrio sp.]